VGQGAIAPGPPVQLAGSRRFRAVALSVAWPTLRIRQGRQQGARVYGATGGRYKQHEEASCVTLFIYSRQLTIEWGQCDPAGIVFNSRFFEMFDTNTWEMFHAALGVRPHELASAFGIMGIPLVDVRANFVKPVRIGDHIEIASRISEFRRSSFDVEHRLAIAGETAVEGAETRVWAARSKDDPEKISGSAIPAEVIAKFARA
jgi:4-hydroxybenzoyl-CoA thioesterase